ncbi:MAG TPA: outer membrane protein assembly factor BamB [Steroidobacteraceae bacterium]|jgi:outer membrane protein assembly factor BamB|nr:outer membrane protein assembly factor BamB [Steroidobacteraceae bacterium]
MRRFVAIGLLLALAACSKDKDVDKPAKLANLQATLRVDRVWGDDVGGAKVPLRLGLALAVDGDRVYAAGRKGDVAAFALATGHQIWRTRTKAPLGGATAVAGGLVAVGSSDGDVIALDAANGRVRWRVRVNGEILSSPAIGPRALVVRTADGKLRGLGVADGKELWQQEQAVPRLSLRGVARPTIAGDMAICGFDNGKVVAVNSIDGTVAWETPVAPPRGRTELERLVDIDSAVQVSAQDVFVVGFQGKVAMLALDTGQVWWSHEASSYRTLGLDDDNIYMASADGEITALTRRTGAEVWHQKALLHRGLSAPTVADDAVVVGDFQGYVHWLDKSTGALAARVSTGKVRISNAPLVAGNLVIVINDRGRISAYRVTPLPGHAKPAARPAAQPATAPIAAPAALPAAPSNVPPAPSKPVPSPSPPAPDTAPPASEPAPTPTPSTAPSTATPTGR